MKEIFQEEPEESFYSKDYLEAYLDDDEISGMEEGFTKEYLG